MMARGVTPVFVLGLQRSGTTLAANLLAAQPGIAAVAARQHHGVHESVFFSHFVPALTPWPAPGGRAQAAQLFLASEYFRLSGLSEQWGAAAAEASPSPAALFCRVMDALAAQQGAAAWVEKSPHHTLLAEQIAAAVPRALFLCVSRDTAGFLRSRLWSYGRQPPRFPRRAGLIARACASNVFHQRYMAALPGILGAQRVFLTDFSTLAAQPEQALAPLLEALRLERTNLRRSGYAANSSFASPAARRRALGRADLLTAKAASAVAQALPQGALPGAAAPSGGAAQQQFSSLGLARGSCARARSSAKGRHWRHRNRRWSEEEWIMRPALTLEVIDTLPALQALRGQLQELADACGAGAFDRPGFLLPWIAAAQASGQRLACLGLFRGRQLTGFLALTFRRDRKALLARRGMAPSYGSSPPFELLLSPEEDEAPACALMARHLVQMRWLDLTFASLPPQSRLARGLMHGFAPLDCQTTRCAGPAFLSAEGVDSGAGYVASLKSRHRRPLAAQGAQPAGGLRSDPCHRGR